MEDAELIQGLRAGDEEAFRALLHMYGSGMLRFAQIYVSNRATAEDVVQEAMVGVLRGIDRFQGKSSLKTWLFSIVANIAKTRGVRESRSIPFSSVEEPGGSVSPDRFHAESERFPGHWAVPPASWAGIPDERLVAGETMEVVRRAIDRLPDAQRTVITLRDVEGFGPDEVCNALDLTETNQRVLLHRARSKVRAALEEYLQ